MATTFESVSGVESLETLLEQSQAGAVILFNHDPYCPISARAYKQMQQVDTNVALVDVSKEKQLTAAIEERMGVRHESPQVIVLRNGEPSWTASHFEITTNAVLTAAGKAS